MKDDVLHYVIGLGDRGRGILRGVSAHECEEASMGQRIDSCLHESALREGFPKPRPLPS